jgi:hypothetical protein
MTPRKKDGIIAMISGAVTLGSGAIAVFASVDPTWLPITISIISAVTTVIFGAKAVVK